jgi:predicted SnoaL-like aldol condensation-catalyzing enzyme
MATTTPEKNKAIVLEAFDTLFNKHDYEAAAHFWPDNYLQHSAHIPPGREGLFDLVRSLSADSHWEHGPIVAEGDYVTVHSRYSGGGAPSALIAIDIVRMEDGRLAEHWDVWESEVTASESKSGLPMFGTSFPT